MTETPTPTISPTPLDALDPERVLARAANDLHRDAQNPASALTAPLVADLEAAFPDLLIHECIGQGGMGAVYRARHKKLDRVVALKILHRELAADPGFQERLSREARSLARLEHPHILGIHNFGEADGYLYLETEFVEGSNLRELMNAGRLPQKEALRLIPQICDALQYAHDNGVIHRDIKPENILIDVDGNATIADFGLAKIRNEVQESLHLTHTQQGLGTPHYVAPEQVGDAANVDHRADIYSVGVVLYEMLTGQLPIGRFPAPSKNSGESSKQLDAAVMRSLETSPARRFQSVEALKEQLTLPPRRRSTRNPIPPCMVGGVDVRKNLPTLATLISFAGILMLAFGGETWSAKLAIVPLGFGACLGALALRDALRFDSSIWGNSLATFAVVAFPMQLVYLFTTTILLDSKVDETSLMVLNYLFTPVVSYALYELFEKFAENRARKLRPEASRIESRTRAQPAFAILPTGAAISTLCAFAMILTGTDGESPWIIAPALIGLALGHVALRHAYKAGASTAYLAQAIFGAWTFLLTLYFALMASAIMDDKPMLGEGFAIGLVFTPFVLAWMTWLARQRTDKAESERERQRESAARIQRLRAEREAKERADADLPSRGSLPDEVTAPE